MLNTLIESRSAYERGEVATAASAGIHIMLIVVAAYMTVASHPDVAEPHPPRIHYTPIRPVINPDRPPNRASGSSAGATAASLRASVNVNISPSVPAVELTLGAVHGSDPTAFHTGPYADAGQFVPSRQVRIDAYQPHEVDTPVSALAGSGVPRYPANLRAAGTEGQVIAQFVVDPRGRAERESVRIISATNDLFAESVRTALGTMRFVPARLGGRTVPQLVRQLFVFRLDR